MEATTSLVEVELPMGALVPPRWGHQPGANKGPSICYPIRRPRPHLFERPEPPPHLLGADEGLHRLACDAHQEPTVGYKGERFQWNGRGYGAPTYANLLSELDYRLSLRARCRGWLSHW